MKAQMLCVISIVCLSLSMSGCCCFINQALVTPTPLPSATQMPTVTATVPATATPYSGTYTPTPLQNTYVESYQISLAAQTGENHTIKITNMGGPGVKYLSYFTVTNNGVPVTPVGLTSTAGSIGVYSSDATVNRIVVVGVFIDNEHKVLMDTSLYT